MKILCPVFPSKYADSGPLCPSKQERGGQRILSDDKIFTDLVDPFNTADYLHARRSLKTRYRGHKFPDNDRSTSASAESTPRYGTHNLNDVRIDVWERTYGTSECSSHRYQREFSSLEFSFSRAVKFSMFRPLDFLLSQESWAFYETKIEKYQREKWDYEGLRNVQFPNFLLEKYWNFNSTILIC